MNKNDWRSQTTPSKVMIQCENNNKTLPADVISINEKVLVAAIQGVKITLTSKRENGVYSGKMGGLDLVYKS